VGLWLLSALVTGCASGADDVGSAREPNVYGVNDRRDWYERGASLSDAEEARFDAIGAQTVGMFVRDRHVRFEALDRVLLCGSNLDDYPSGRTDACFTRTLDWSVFSSSSFGDDEIALCNDEPYGLQPSIGRCSGTLIAADLVLTSGHCLDEHDDPESSVFVFNWRYESAPEGASYEYRSTVAGDVAFWIEQPAPGLAPMTRDDVYHVIRTHFVYDTASRLRPSGSTTDSPTQDYAIAQLDRPVALPRRPARINYDEAAPAIDDTLVAAGFGKGLPLKIDDGARVIESWYCDPSFNPALVCNLHDGYSGGSGSGLFTRDGALVAAHRGSATDFVLDEAEGCYRSRVVPEDVPDTSFPAAAHRAAWAVDEFCVNGFATDSALCGDPELRVTDASACPDGTVHAPGDALCCARACSSDVDCDVDGWGGGCDAGVCRRSGTCFAGELWERDACGRPVFPMPESAESCHGAGGACDTATPIEAIDQRIALSSAGARDDAAGSCGGGYGGELVFRFELAETTEVSVALDGAALGWLLYLRGSACGADDELGCAASDRTMDARIDQRLSPGVYYVFADTAPADDPRAEVGVPGPVLDLRFRTGSASDGGLGDGGTAPSGDGGCDCAVTAVTSDSDVRPLAPMLGCLALALLFVRRLR